MAEISANGCNLLKQFEGYLNPSKRLKGEKYYTVGYGHYGPDVKPDTRYSEEDIRRFFMSDSSKFSKNVNRIYNPSRGMTQNMFDAMFCFAYNHGNITNTSLGQAIAQDPLDFNKIQRIWENSYVLVGSRYENGLRNRRKREAQLYCGEKYDADANNAASSESYDSGGERDDNSFVYEENKAIDVSSGINNEDYDLVNSGSFEVRIDDGWNQYETFVIQEDDNARVLGENELVINADKHGSPQDPDEHKLIRDEELKPSIEQDEHSAPIKEDTDLREEDNSVNPDTESVNWTGNSPHGGMFAI